MYQGNTSKIIQWVMKSGFAKDEKQASYVILGFIALVVMISLFLVFGRGGASEREKFAPPAEAPAEELIPPAKF